MLGVGSSLEESTIYNLSRMSAAGRDGALRRWSTRSTAPASTSSGSRFGTSDFTSHAFYTYDDGAADPSLSRFSIQRDVDYQDHLDAPAGPGDQPEPQVLRAARGARPPG
jgi:hypothetical protein